MLYCLTIVMNEDLNKELPLREEKRYIDTSYIDEIFLDYAIGTILCELWFWSTYETVYQVVLSRAKANEFSGVIYDTLEVLVKTEFKKV